MKTLVIGLFLVVGVAVNTSLLAQVSQIPQSIREEMKAEQPEHRETIKLASFLVATILHFPKAKLWVVTKLHLVAPNKWAFDDDDIENISREVEGKLVVLYKRGKQV